MKKRSKIVVPSIVAFVVATIFISIISHSIGNEPFISFFVEETVSTQEPEIVPKEYWWDKDSYVYHACGQIGDLAYTNSKEAIENTLSKGKRLIEVDFLITSDDELICSHYWDKDDNGEENILTFDEFMTSSISDSYTPLSALDIISYMRKYDDLYLVVDTKEENLSEVIYKLGQACYFDNELMDRMIIQLYKRGDKEDVSGIYSFPEENYMFSEYKIRKSGLDEVLDICINENISFVVVDFKRITDEHLEKFKDNDISVFVHTVNTPNGAKNFLDSGVKGIYTDKLF